MLSPQNIQSHDPCEQCSIYIPWTPNHKSALSSTSNPLSSQTKLQIEKQLGAESHFFSCKDLIIFSPFFSKVCHSCFWQVENCFNWILLSNSFINKDIFAMAQIHRIGHDHHTPFWGVVVVVLLLGYQAVTRGENKLPHGQYTLDPQYFYILWTS